MLPAIASGLICFQVHASLFVYLPPCFLYNQVWKTPDRPPCATSTPFTLHPMSTQAQIRGMQVRWVRDYFEVGEPHHTRSMPSIAALYYYRQTRRILKKFKEWNWRVPTDDGTH